MTVTPQILNEAMSAYVQTFSMLDRLSEHITRRGLEHHKIEIVSELDAVLKTAGNHLYTFPGGVPWTDVFERAYRGLLIERHPWLDANSLDRVFAFSRWLCWHDGLNA